MHAHVDWPLQSREQTSYFSHCQQVFKEVKPASNDKDTLTVFSFLSFLFVLHFRTHQCGVLSWTQVGRLCWNFKVKIQSPEKTTQP